MATDPNDSGAKIAHEETENAAKCGPTSAIEAPFPTHSEPAQAQAQAQAQVKPSASPGFFQKPPPAGRSRESTIVLDSHGRFYHDGVEIDHVRLSAAMHRWIRRHPDNARYILCNEYDWSYFTVSDAPFFVTSLYVDETGVWLELSDGSKERLIPGETFTSPTSALYTRVKQSTYWAKFSRHAQLQLEPFLEELDGEPALQLPAFGSASGARTVVIGHRTSFI
jgi:hypothetical protein